MFKSAEERNVLLFLCSALLAGIGMDASVSPLRHAGLCLVQTTDFFYPLVDDPYMQGKALTGCNSIYIIVSLSVMLFYSPLVI